MNRCDEYQELLSAYIDDMLPENEKEAVRQHLLHCDTCAQEYEMLKTIVSACSELEEELPEGFEETLHQRLVAAKDQTSASKSRLPNIKLFTQIAAGFVIVITLGFVIRTGLFFPKNTGNGNKEAASEAPSAMSLNRPITADSAPMLDGSGESFDIASTPVENYAGKETARSQVALKSAAGTNVNDVSVTFTAMEKNDGHDTVVRIEADDIQAVIQVVEEIQVKLDYIDNEKQYFADRKLQNTEQTVTEIKLTYPNDQLWHEFLSNLQVIYPEMQLESVPAQEAEEYIRIQIQQR